MQITEQEQLQIECWILNTIDGTHRTGTAPKSIAGYFTPSMELTEQEQLQINCWIIHTIDGTHGTGTAPKSIAGYFILAMEVKKVLNVYERIKKILFFLVKTPLNPLFYWFILVFYLKLRALSLVFYCKKDTLNTIIQF